MKLAQVLCLLIILGSSAIAAHAQTPVDPHPTFGVPDVPCNGTTSICFTYSGPAEAETLTFTFNAPTAIPISAGTLDTLFSCSITDTLELPPAHPTCAPFGNGTDASSTEFLGITLTVPDIDDYPGLIGGPFNTQLTITGGALILDVPENLSCSNGCTGGQFTVDPVPEPTTGLLFASGLLLVSLGGFVRRRSRVNPLI